MAMGYVVLPPSPLRTWNLAYALFIRHSYCIMPHFLLPVAAAFWDATRRPTRPISMKLFFISDIWLVGLLK